MKKSTVIKQLSLDFSVDGQTEGYFVKYVLAEYLQKYNIFVGEPLVLGGNVTIHRVAQTLNLLSYQYNYVTSLYDFYGFQGMLQNETPTQLLHQIKTNPIIANKKLFSHMYKYMSLKPYYFPMLA